jgi:hypothetical protein
MYAIIVFIGIQDRRYVDEDGNHWDLGLSWIRFLRRLVFNIGHIDCFAHSAHNFKHCRSCHWMDGSCLQVANGNHGIHLLRDVDRVIFLF